MNLSEMRTLVRRDLHDEDSNNYRWSNDELDRLRSGLGEFIKQHFGLYAGNEALLQACSDRGSLLRPIPEEACAVILRALWKDLQATHRLRIVK